MPAVFGSDPKRRLRKASDRLTSVRRELAVVEEQHAALAWDADAAELDAAVAGDRWSAHVAGEDRRHADALERRRRDLRAEIARLEAEQDALLDRLSDRLVDRRPDGRGPGSG
jgi:hypothetical protein